MAQLSRSIAAGQFTYEGSLLGGEKEASVWIMQLYNGIVYRTENHVQMPFVIVTLGSEESGIDHFLSEVA